MPLKVRTSALQAFEGDAQQGLAKYGIVADISRTEPSLFFRALLWCKRARLVFLLQR